MTAPVDRLCWRATDTIARLLDVEEQDVVRGDLIECGARGPVALRQVAGLVARRQAHLWTDWRAWFAVAAIALPVGVLLSHVSRWWADASAVYLSIWWRNLGPILRNPGARIDLAYDSANFLLRDMTLIAWAWTSGFVVGRISRRTAWMATLVFALAVLVATAGTTTVARANGFNTSVFSQTLYGEIYPRVMRLAFVVLPAIHGMRRGARTVSLPLVPAIAGCVALITLTFWTGEALHASVILGRYVSMPQVPPPDTTAMPMPRWPAQNPVLQRSLVLTLTWPACYLLATTLAARFRRVQ